MKNHDDEIFQFNKLSHLHDGEKIIFCKTDYLQSDFQDIRKKTNKVILMTGNSDYSITEEISSAMPENIHHWFCVNNLTNDKRITSMPLGLDNCFDALRKDHGKGWDHAIQKRKTLASTFCSNNTDEIEGLVYGNFTVCTNLHWRRAVARACDESEFINYNKYPTEPSEFYSKILSHKMVVCPLGNAPQGQSDNHRIYETLYCNRVPIVFFENQNILYKSIYSKLPVIMLDSIEDLYNKNKIVQMYEEVKDKPIETIKYSFWENKILQKAKEI